MGVRIHKAMGWGLTNVRYDRRKWRFRDSRINPDSPLLTHTAGDYADLVAYVKRTSQDEFDVMLAELAAKSGDALEPQHCVIFEPEFGLPNVLLLVPPPLKSWSRYDDPIDYAEAKNATPKVRRLPHAPHPYDGLFMDADTGKPFWPLDGHDPRLFRMLLDVGEAKLLESGGPEVLDRLAQETLGIPTWKDACRRFVPNVPSEIVALATWGELFTDPTVVRQLRPLLYTYWA